MDLPNTFSGAPIFWRLACRQSIENPWSNRIGVGSKQNWFEQLSAVGLGKGGGDGFLHQPDFMMDFVMVGVRQAEMQELSKAYQFAFWLLGLFMFTPTLECEASAATALQLLLKLPDELQDVFSSISAEWASALLDSPVLLHFMSVSATGTFCSPLSSPWTKRPWALVYVLFLQFACEINSMLERLQAAFQEIYGSHRYLHWAKKLVYIWYKTVASVGLDSIYNYAFNSVGHCQEHCRDMPAIWELRWQQYCVPLVTRSV